MNNICGLQQSSQSPRPVAPIENEDIRACHAEASNLPAEPGGPDTGQIGDSGLRFSQPDDSEAAWQSYCSMFSAYDTSTAPLGPVVDPATTEENHEIGQMDTGVFATNELWNALPPVSEEEVFYWACMEYLWWRQFNCAGRMG